MQRNFCNILTRYQTENKHIAFCVFGRQRLGREIIRNFGKQCQLAVCIYASRTQ